MRVSSVLSVVAVLGLLGVAGTESALAVSEGVIVTGYQVNEDDPPPFPNEFSPAELAALEGAADLGLSILLHKVGIDPGTAEFGDITEAVDEFWDTATNPKGKRDEGNFVVFYSPCMMQMIAQGNAMAVRLPPGQPVAFMEGYDSSGEGFVLELNRDLAAAANVVGSGWSSGIDIEATGNSGNIIGYPSDEYRFAYEGGLGGGMLGFMSGHASVKTEGSMWASPSVPGWSIVEEFYRNFSAQVSSQAETSFYGGLLDNMVGMLQKGMPLYTYHNTESRMGQRTLASGRSESWVTYVTVVERDWASCDASTIPAGIEPTVIDSSMLPGQADSPQKAACDCSCEAFKRMAEMGDGGGDQPTAEQQAMAMCMMECSGQFMQCAMQMSR